MPGGLRNPLSVTHMLEKVGEVVQTTKDKARTRKTSLTKKMGELGIKVPYVDLHIQFIGASGLPKMDVVGSADPYFVAKLDDEITFVSTVKQGTLSPVWNEVWKLKNVPTTADLVIKIMDKDEGLVTDDYIGTVNTSVSAGAKECEIEGPVFRRSRGTFWLKIDSTHPADEDPHKYPYLFDGPVRYSRHFSPTVGALTALNDARLYSTWKVFLKGVRLFFGDTYQHWNKDYPAAQKIFQGPTSLAVRSGIQAGHRMLYARTPSNGFGIIEDKEGIMQILQAGSSLPGSAANNNSSSNTANTANTSPFAHRVKPAVYTYILSSEDDSFRFSETGAAFFVDFASKHALHSNCCETVRYSGDWELVIDNNSGTYAPDKGVLPAVKALLEFNFPGFAVFAMDHGDGELKKSREACREYALRFRGVKQEELQPHAKEGEETLSHQAEAGLKSVERGVSSVEHGVSSVV
ncbi:hypothetical protein GALMADRAFT_58979 [Galerina marginata CBS 339.88]|uniref:C2 domain-containing protein n=1 Tax=Galerina marginata (strain CBS 339.88) TaxID=685588 RepID=A0A067TII2_GALM3|nr:hypothetical protein GALMADRAFT_58979 [Galerina marginata CBS 339.88]